jgi:hypothetical protein
MRLGVLVVVFVVFTAWSATVIAGHGFGGLFALIGRESWAAQMFVDLCISLTVAWSWLVPDARSRGINPWPYIGGTLVLGSIAVLAFLIHRTLRSREKGSAAAA